jgi:hypothetical protein
LDRLETIYQKEILIHNMNHTLVKSNDAYQGVVTEWLNLGEHCYNQIDTISKDVKTLSPSNTITITQSYSDTKLIKERVDAIQKDKKVFRLDIPPGTIRVILSNYDDFIDKALFTSE